MYEYNFITCSGVTTSGLDLDVDRDDDDEVPTVRFPTPVPTLAPDTATAPDDEDNPTAAPPDPLDAPFDTPIIRDRDEDFPFELFLPSTVTSPNPVSLDAQSVLGEVSVLRSDDLTDDNMMDDELSDMIPDDPFRRPLLLLMAELPFEIMGLMTEARGKRGTPSDETVTDGF